MDNIKIEQIIKLEQELIINIQNESMDEGFKFINRLREEYINGNNRFSKPGECLYGIFDSNNLIGICGLNIDPYFNDNFIGRVRHLFIGINYRRNGLGKLLMSNIIDKAKINYKLLTLRTDNPQADLFYQAVGFKKINNISLVTHYLKFTSEIYFLKNINRILY